MTRNPRDHEQNIDSEVLVAAPEHRESAVEMQRNQNVEVGIVLDDEEDESVEDGRVR